MRAGAARSTFSSASDDVTPEMSALYRARRQAAVIGVARMIAILALTLHIICRKGTQSVPAH